MRGRRFLGEAFIKAMVRVQRKEVQWIGVLALWPPPASGFRRFV
jgi:hypothetical protein